MKPSNSAGSRAWKRRIGAAVATVAVASLALTGCTSAQSRTVEVPALATGQLSADIVGQLQSATETAMGQFGASGAIVGVWVPWAGSWVSGLGTQATGSATPATVDMSFRVGEITREMTCDALYGMVDDGIVKLDDSIAKYVVGVDSINDDVSDVTLQNLCDSTSGIAGVPGNVRVQYITLPDRQWRARELASLGLASPKVGKPGEKYVSSDTNYLLLGLALESASGLKAQEYIAKYVTEPLGLDSTELPGSASAKPGPSTPLTGQLPVVTDGVTDCTTVVDMTKRSASSGFTNAGVTSTITDLGTYALALAKGSLRGPDQKSRFEAPLPAADGAQSWDNAGGGSRLTGPLIGQVGTTAGYVTAAYSDPQSGLTIALTMNSSAVPISAENLALQLAAIASKAPAVSGQTAPDSGLTWTAEQYAEKNAGYAVCQTPAAG